MKKRETRRITKENAKEGESGRKKMKGKVRESQKGRENGKGIFVQNELFLRL